MKLNTLTALLSLGLFANAQAAKYYPSQQLKSGSLELMKGQMTEFCAGMAGSNLDCDHRAFVIESKNVDEPWKNSVKQIIYAQGNGYVEEVTGRMLRRDQNGAHIIHALYEVLSNAGYDFTPSTDIFNPRNNPRADRAVEDLIERISNDHSNSNMLYVKGAIGGAHDLDHKYLAIIDTKKMEVLIFNAGYSE